MKRIIVLLMALTLMGTAQESMAQQRKTTARKTAVKTTTARKTTATKSVTPSAVNVLNPLVGNWWYEEQYGLELSLKADCKKGNFIYDDKSVCHGGLAVSEYFEYFMMLSMNFKQKISDDEFEFNVWGSDNRKKTKKVTGTIRLKQVGSKLLITGTEASGKKWPFSGLYLEASK